MIQSPETFSVKDVFCSYCGFRFAEQKTWPRKCFHCGNDSYKNPIPIIVVLLKGENGSALLQKRNIDPQKGKWALTSGYIEHGETYKEAALRETKEEIGLDLKQYYIELYDVANSDTGNMLIFVKYMMRINIKDCFFNSEVSEVKLVDIPIELAYPIQTYYLNKYLGEP